jgi:SagB-type dehydrogenase family enzyme
LDSLLEYHEATKHSPASVQASRFALDWPNQPIPFKVYTSLDPIPLPLTFSPSTVSALDAIAGTFPHAEQEISHVATHDPAMSLELLARLCYFANGITRVLQRHGQKVPFRAAACTGALYHIELYLVCAALTADPSDPCGEGSESHVALEAGVYHYAAHDNALQLLRSGDFRGVLSSASGGEPTIAQAPVVMVCTSTFWRNAWKYQARAYRHAFWDTGTIVANLLGVASANNVSARLVVGFADEPVNTLLDVDPAQEAAICLVSLGRGASPAPAAPPVEPLRLRTQPLSATQVDYPAITAAHQASSLATAAAASAWRSAATSAEAIADTVGSAPAAIAKPPSWTVTSAKEPPLNADLANPVRGRPATSIEQVILRRGSARRFSAEPIGLAQLMDMLVAATRPIPADIEGQSMTEPYLIVNAVDGLAAGAYVFHKTHVSLELLKAGDFRAQATFLDLGQDLAGQAAVNVYWLADLNAILKRLGNRGYRAAQLEAAIEGGRLYLAAYALGLGATGLTFFDDDVTRFLAPRAASRSVMFLDAVGHPAKRTA